MCGFSGQVVQILDYLGVPYKGLNVLENDDLRGGIKNYSNWPTIPQLYVKGEFVGGCDIIREMFQAGELQSLLKDNGIAVKRKPRFGLVRRFPRSPRRRAFIFFLTRPCAFLTHQFAFLAPVLIEYPKRYAQEQIWFASTRRERDGDRFRHFSVCAVAKRCVPLGARPTFAAKLMRDRSTKSAKKRIAPRRLSASSIRRRGAVPSRQGRARRRWPARARALPSSSNGRRRRNPVRRARRARSPPVRARVASTCP